MMVQRVSDIHVSDFNVVFCLFASVISDVGGAG